MTIKQVRQYNLPPNPAKLSDSRAAEFIKRYGPESWEVDALPPATLQTLLRAALEAVLDKDKMQQVEQQEEVAKERLQELMEDLE